MVRKHAFYWRYDTGQELELLNRLWQLVALRLNFFTPTKSPVGYSTTANGRRKRVYDKPATPWQRLQASGVLDTQHLANVAARIEGINPADLTRHQRDPNAATGPGQGQGQGQDRGPRRHSSHRSRALNPSTNRLAKAK
ncbi:hypothetical protein [Mycobacterium asiaticum]|uniref:hypothetical protein n=1 Tax=Mycobacterium asiaticum TaxID=1790 RepID=UPI000B1ABE49|nr:hypothetical protein [Mycobacterium asiaticum]